MNSKMKLIDDGKTVTGYTTSQWWTAQLVPCVSYQDRGNNLHKCRVKLTGTSGYTMLGIAKKQENINSTEWYYKNSNTCFIAPDEYTHLYHDGHEESIDRKNINGKVVTTTVDMNSGEIIWEDDTGHELRRYTYDKLREGDWYFTYLLTSDAGKV